MGDVCKRERIKKGGKKMHELLEIAMTYLPLLIISIAGVWMVYTNLEMIAEEEQRESRRR